ncbi:MAG: YidC/Oxa1 family membrane protein insertase [Oscillospiraceae bacterium]|nr:YidC/Oxa1 family membrane protein insertase [Oscillospiraceae bacterium]
MWGIYHLVNNYGIAILIFTVLIRLLLFPLSVNQQKSTAAMSAINPKLEQLKKKYANNQQKLQEEQMKLYSEENINPMASCLPMVLQLVFLYGVFDVIYKPLTHILRLSATEIELLKNTTAQFFEGNNAFNSRPELYIVSAMQNPANMQTYLDAGVTQSVMDQVMGFHNKLFGFIDLGIIPKSVIEGGFTFSAQNVGLILIPVIAGLLQLFTTIYSTAKQKKLNPDASQAMGSMNAMLYAMPLMSVWIGFGFAAGLGFYWICSSLVGLVQMVVLNKIYTPEYVQKLIEKDKAKNKTKKRSGLMQKYNEMMQEQMRQNQQQTTESKPVDDDGNKLSNAKMKEYEKKIIAEARRRQAEKYGDDLDDEGPV